MTVRTGHEPFDGEQEHPSGDELLAFVDGDVSDERYGAIVEHLALCSLCMQTVDAMAEPLDGAYGAGEEPARAPATVVALGRAPAARPAAPAWRSWLPIAASIAVAAVGLSTWGLLQFRAWRSANVPEAAPSAPTYISTASDLGPTPRAPETLRFRWSPQPAGNRLVGVRQPVLPTELAFREQGAVVMGAGDAGGVAERVRTAQRATVIVRTAFGWGSGTIVSGAGWIVTNYHVIAAVVQTSSLDRRAASVDVLLPQFANGRIRPGPPRKALVFRVDPVRDLALIKLASVDGTDAGFPHLSLADRVVPGERCMAVGSRPSGFAWEAKGCTVGPVFVLPDDLSRNAGGLGAGSVLGTRGSTRVVASSADISEGDSGGPLVNDASALIGLTFPASANRIAGATGWHVSLDELRRFLASWPSAPEPVPFDLWSGGLNASLGEPHLEDRDRDGLVDTLEYTHLDASTSNGTVVGVTTFVDLEQKAPRASDDRTWMKPTGLWGVDGGRFRFDVAVTVRADGVVAVGYTSRSGVLEEIRVSKGDVPGLVWRRMPSGQWQPSGADGAPVLESRRFDEPRRRRLMAALSKFLG